MKIARYIFVAIAFLAMFVTVLVAVMAFSGADTFHEHLYGEAPFSLGAFLDDLWPAPILTAFAIVVTLIVVVATLSSDTLEKWLKSIPLSGNVLVSFLFLIYLSAMILVIELNEIVYPLPLEPDDFSPMMKVGVISLCNILVFPSLIFMNNSSLARPASNFLIAGIWVVLVVITRLWTQSVILGEVDFLRAIKLF